MKFRTAILSLLLVSATFFVLISVAPEKAEGYISRDYDNGADAYGYNFTDSKEPQPTVPFNWMPLSVGAIPIWALEGVPPTDDYIYGGAGGFPLSGWMFPFYGFAYPSVWVSDNGFITFMRQLPMPPMPWEPIPYPNTTFTPPNPNNFISCYGDQFLNPDPLTGGGGIIWWDELLPPMVPVPTLVVTWDLVPNGIAPQTFQIIIEATGVAWCQYLNVTTKESPPVVGIENEPGEIGLRYKEFLEDNLTIEWSAIDTVDTLNVAWTDYAPLNAEYDERDVVMLRLDMSMAPGSVGTAAVMNITVLHSAGPGMCTDTDINSVHLWWDKNANGIIDTGIDEPIAMDFFNGIMGIPGRADLFPSSFMMPFALPPVWVSPTAPVTLLITYDMGILGAPVACDMQIPAGGITLVRNFPPLGDTLVGGFPMTSSLTNITPPNADPVTITANSMQPGLPPLIEQGETYVPIMLLFLNALGGDNVDISNITVTLTGTATATDIYMARLIHDVDDDGLYDARVDVEIGSNMFGGGPPPTANIWIWSQVMSMMPSYLRVNPGIPERLILAIDVDYAATPGATAGLSVASVGIGTLDINDQGSVTLLPDPFAANQIQVAQFLRDNHAIVSSSLVTPVTIDGQYVTMPDEWGDATGMNIAIPVYGNQVDAVLYVKNDPTYLYVCIDAIGDTDRGTFDSSIISFDTQNDTLATDGRDDQFMVGGFFNIPKITGHFIYNTTATWWIVEDSPFNTGLPNHTGLAAYVGFNSSANSAVFHRIYEYRIPLDLIEASPGNWLGFMVGGIFADVMDWETWFTELFPRYTTWPQHYPFYNPSGMDLNFTGLLCIAPCVGINTPPEAKYLGVQGYLTATAGIMHITDHTPDLNWTFYDADGDPQTQYEVRVGTAPGLNDMWAPGVQAGAITTVTYAGAALIDSADYWFGVRVHDGTVWSVWNETQFHMNTILAPTIPVTPPDAANIPASATQTVSWTPGGPDPEGDTVTYYWQVSQNDNTFAPANIIASGTTIGTTSTAFATLPLTMYYWRVNATDSWEFSNYGNTPPGYWMFTTTANTAPEAQYLGVQSYLEATAGIMNITDHTPDLNWTYFDADGNPQTQYEVRVGTAPGLSDMWAPGVQAGAITTVTYAGAALIDSADYWFGVRVHDGTVWSVWNETQFHMNTILAPTIPVTPPDAANIPASATQTVSWTPGGPDPEGDTVTYYWQVSQNDNTFAPANIIASGTTIGTTSTAFATLPLTTYYWRANATDSWEFSDYGNTPPGYWLFTTTPTIIGIITGKVVEEGTINPIEGAIVQLENSTAVIVATYTTNSTGDFEFTDVPFDSYTLLVSKEGYEDNDTTTTTISSGSPSQDTGNIELTPIAVTTTGTVEGYVYDSEGNPVQGATVELLDDNGNLVGTDTTDSNGKYEFPSVDFGTYTIKVKRTGYEDSTSGEFTLDADNPTAFTTSTLAPTTAPPLPEIPWWIWILLVVLAIIIVLLLALLMGKRKKPEEEAPPAIPVEPEAPPIPPEAPMEMPPEAPPAAPEEMPPPPPPPPPAP